MKNDINLDDSKVINKGYKVERISPIYHINAITNFGPLNNQNKKNNHKEEIEKSFHELFNESLQRLAEEEIGQQPFESEIEEVRKRR